MKRANNSMVKHLGRAIYIDKYEIGNAPTDSDSDDGSKKYWGDLNEE